MGGLFSSAPKVDISLIDQSKVNLLSFLDVPYNGSVYDFGIRLQKYLLKDHDCDFGEVYSMLAAGYMVVHRNFTSYKEWRVVIPNDKNEILSKTGLNSSLCFALRLASRTLEDFDEDELVTSAQEVLNIASENDRAIRISDNGQFATDTVKYYAILADKSGGNKATWIEIFAIKITVIPT